MVNITSSAKNYLNSIKPDNDYVSLSVKSGGCAGFQYVWGFAKDNNDIQWSNPIDNVLVIDPMSELYILGSTIDYVVELGGSFLSVKNPMSSSNCGCGESFGI